MRSISITDFLFELNQTPMAPFGKPVSATSRFISMIVGVCDTVWKNVSRISLFSSGSDNIVLERFVLVLAEAEACWVEEEEVKELDELEAILGMEEEETCGAIARETPIS